MAIDSNIAEVMISALLVFSSWTMAPASTATVAVNIAHAVEVRCQ